MSDVANLASAPNSEYLRRVISFQAYLCAVVAGVSIHFAGKVSDRSADSYDKFLAETGIVWLVLMLLFVVFSHQCIERRVARLIRCVVIAAMTVPACSVISFHSRLDLAPNWDISDVVSIIFAIAFNGLTFTMLYVFSRLDLPSWRDRLANLPVATSCISGTLTVVAAYLAITR